MLILAVNGSGYKELFCVRLCKTAVAFLSRRKPRKIQNKVSS